MSLARVLRTLATHHIFREVSPDVFTNNAVSLAMDTGKTIEAILAEYVLPHIHSRGQLRICIQPRVKIRQYVRHRGSSGTFVCANGTKASTSICSLSNTVPMRSSRLPHISQKCSLTQYGVRQGILPRRPLRRPSILMCPYGNGLNLQITWVGFVALVQE